MSNEQCRVVGAWENPASQSLSPRELEGNVWQLCEDLKVVSDTTISRYLGRNRIPNVVQCAHARDNRQVAIMSALFREYGVVVDELG